MELIKKQFNDLSVDELYRILRLRSEVFVVEQDSVYLDCDNNDQACLHLFYKDGDEIVAYLRVIPAKLMYEYASIGRIITNPNYRKQGLAGKLISEAIQIIINEFKEGTIKIQAQAYLENYYSTFGFKSISEAYMFENLLHIDMLYQV